MNTSFKVTLLSAAIASVSIPNIVQASHFRGAAVVPEVSSTGLLTVDAKSFWRVGSPDGVRYLQVTNTTTSTVVGNITPSSSTQDASDSRRIEVNEELSMQLPGAGLYELSWSSGSWVHSVPNASGSFGTTSSIYWDGSTANSPIFFDLENIQQEVVRGTTYSDNLDVIGTVTYDDTFLAIGMSSQAAGYSIDASGQITIANPTYADNANSSSVGADQAFSGEINAADGSSVEFVWLFDAVDTGSVVNQAPTVADDVVAALVGDVISETIVITDPDLDTVTGSFVSLLDGSGTTITGSSFNTSTFEFSWDSTGYAPGTYQAVFEGSDGSLTDRGTLTINLSAATTAVSEPASIFLAGMGAFAFMGMRRRKRSL